MEDPIPPHGLSERTRSDIRAVLSGERRGWRAFLPFLGPAVVTSIAYIDPGNFATNIQAGASFGYDLLWVVLLANLVGMLVQALSARLGIVTGRSLPELCRDHLPPSIVVVMWIISEVAAMATDLAEFLGGALGLALLFHLPIMVGMVVTALLTYGILTMQRAGFRPIELLIGAFVGIIGLCYLLELAIAPIDWAAVGMHTFVPGLPNGRALLLGVGIVGATVMPHAIYLQSSLTQHRAEVRNDSERARVLGFSRDEVILALGMAGLINMAMVAMAASAFHTGHAEVAEIESAYHTLTPLLGASASGIFLLSLIVSGISSSVVGTMAGQVIMQGFVGFRIPLWLRRLVTMVPAFIVVALGVNPTEALVVSQVVLSLTLPVPMIALVVFTSRGDVMGIFANSRPVASLAAVATVLVVALNLVLLLQTFGVAIPGLPTAD